MQKANRLSKNWQFQAIIENNKQVVTKYLVIYYMPNQVGTTRIGISISKKFVHAVGRNYQKRQTRAVLDLLKPEVLSITPTKDLVVILRKPFLDASFEKKVTTLRDALVQL